NLSEENWDLQSQKVYETIEKLKQQPYTIDDVFDRIFQGIASGGDKFFFVEEIENHGDYGVFYSSMLNQNVKLEYQILKPVLKGQDVNKYENPKVTLYTLFPYSIVKNKPEILSFTEIEDRYPLAASYFLRNEKFLKEREKG